MSQIMLTVIVGTSYALFRAHNPAPRKSLVPALAHAWQVLALLSAFWLGGFTSYELKSYLGNNLEGTAFVGGGWSPRYWRHGKLIIVTSPPP